MGSGSVGVAALRLGRRFLGNDLNPDAVRLSGSRLQELGAGRLPEGLSADAPVDLLTMLGSEA